LDCVACFTEWLMKFYYTGAKTAGGEQTDPLASIGGYVSNTEVPEAQLGNIFGAPSKLIDTDLRIIAITNNDTTAYTGITCAINNVPANLTELLVAFAPMRTDAFSQPVAPKPNITNIYQSVTLPIPDMPPGSSLALFIKRNVKYPVPGKTAQELLDIESGILTEPLEEVLQLTFNYTVTPPAGEGGGTT